jgi:hypothetical protein
MKYYDKHSCGHEGMVELFGPTSQREWRRKKYFEDECPECQQKRRDAENAASAMRAAEMGLPALIGTAKQVAWAETRRVKFCDASDGFAGDDTLRATIGYILERERYASFWIEDAPVEYYSIREYARRHEAQIKAYMEAPAPMQPEAPRDEAEVLRPAEIKHEGVVAVELLQTGDAAWTIRARYEKDEAFRDVVAKRHLGWDGAQRCWARAINVMSAPGDDRAAELISRLLKAGFCVSCDSAPVRELVLSGAYKPENRLWVARKNDVTVRFKFDRDDSLNEKVRGLGARWDGEGYEISAAKYNKVEEFARLYGFSITPNAQAALQTAREKVEGATVVAPTVKPVLRAKDNPLAEILKSNCEVLPDLRDGK